MELIIFFFALGLSSVMIKLFSYKMGWNVSWLLPIVLGLVIAVLITAFFSINQKKIQVTEDTVQVSADPINTVPSKSTLNEDLSDVEAYEFAQELYKKIESDEKFLEDAFELKEEQTLDHYVVNDWFEFANRPHRFSPRALAQYGNVYFPDGDVMKPYFVCDTAFRDLNIYAGAMERAVNQDSAINRKILRQEQADFLKSKELCSKRISMSYVDALADYENE